MTSIRYTLFKNEDGFNLPKPNLLLSIIGGNFDFVMNENERTELQLTIKKLAKDTDTLLIANGLNEGVSAIAAGDLLEIDSKRNNLNLLAIAPSHYETTESDKNVDDKTSTHSKSVASFREANCFVSDEDSCRAVKITKTFLRMEIINTLYLSLESIWVTNQISGLI